MRILLLNPTTLDSQNRPMKFREAFQPPLSLAILASLTPKQHTIRVVNDVVQEAPLSENWDLVGITLMTAQAERAYQLADAFRARGAKVVLGGIHASMVHEEAKQHADAVVVGEAEDLWEQLLVDCERGQLRDYYHSEELPDLKRAVIPRWDCFDLSIYAHRLGSKLPAMPVYTTRGCPFACRFCSVTKFFGRSYRTRPIATVLSEIQGVQTKDFFFADDNVVAEPDYARELFAALRPLDIQWMCQLSTTVLKQPDLLDRAAEAGCMAALVGVESLSKESLRSARKSFNKIELYEELVRRLRHAGITPILSFIFGFDEDHEDQFESTLEFVTRHHIGSPMFWILTPLPGTDLYDEMKRDGRITSTRWSSYDAAHLVFRPKTWSPEDLTERYWKTYQQVYRPPRYLRNIYWNTRSANRPWPALLRNCFMQPYYWSRIRRREHPYCGGIGRVASPPVTAAAAALL